MIARFNGHIFANVPTNGVATCRLCGKDYREGGLYGPCETMLKKPVEIREGHRLIAIAEQDSEFCIECGVIFNLCDLFRKDMLRCIKAEGFQPRIVGNALTPEMLEQAYQRAITYTDKPEASSPFEPCKVEGCGNFQHMCSHPPGETSVKERRELDRKCHFCGRCEEECRSSTCQLWPVYPSNPFATAAEQLDEAFRATAACECGATKCGDNQHSSWCPARATK